MTCDKCDKPVSSNEDITYLDAIAFEDPSRIISALPRHILCSPSRAQYIVHEDFPEVVEKRPRYDKFEVDSTTRISREKIYTEAWIKLQKEQK